jgi:hypothetical protein
MLTKTNSLDNPGCCPCNIHRPVRMLELRAVIHPHNHPNTNPGRSDGHYSELCIYSGEYNHSEGNDSNMGEPGHVESPNPQ